ncbi:MAG: YciI family protein [Bacteroidota bacterium]
MRIQLLLSFIIALFLCNQIQVSAQQKKTGNEPDPEEMTGYFMVFLKTGPDRSHDSLTTAKIQEGHMAHIMQTAKNKKLLLAGPFLDKGDLRGIFILDVATMEEAIELTNQDPAVKAGRLTIEIHPWYGPVKLREIEWF